jgi:hypothetical protein
MSDKAYNAFIDDLDKIIEFMEVQRKQHTVMFDGLTSLITLFNAYKFAVTEAKND